MRNLPFIAAMVSHYRLVRFSAILGTLASFNWYEKIDFT